MTHGLWHPDGASTQRQEGLVNKPFQTPESWFQRLFPSSSFSDQSTSQPGFAFVSLFTNTHTHTHTLLLVVRKL